MGGGWWDHHRYVLTWIDTRGLDCLALKHVLKSPRRAKFIVPRVSSILGVPIHVPPRHVIENSFLQHEEHLDGGRPLSWQCMHARTSLRLLQLLG